MRFLSRESGGSATALALVLTLQAVAAVFFVSDVLADLTAGGVDAHVVLEAAVCVALVVGTVFGAREMRRTLERAERDAAALATARGALGELIAARFEAWGLTAAEREVALFALKGFDIAAIAGLRGAAPGTVRAQLARIYGKAGVASRPELLSLFIEDLLGDPIVPDGAPEMRPTPTTVRR